MGLFDGAAEAGAGDNSSTAGLAARSGWPVILVVDAARQSQSVAALVRGFRDHRKDVHVAGVILNRVGSDRHQATLIQALNEIAVPVLGSLPRTNGLERPSRHLGLVQAAEHADLADYLDGLADLVSASVDLGALQSLAKPSSVQASEAAVLPPLGQRIAVARDAAFGFCYPHLIDGWKRAGAEISWFSPLADEGPTDGSDAVYLPGGYPELYAETLADARTFQTGVKRAPRTAVGFMASAVGSWSWGRPLSMRAATGTPCSTFCP